MCSRGNKLLFGAVNTTVSSIYLWLTLVNLNKCCDFDDLLIDAYLKKSHCTNQQSMNFF